MQYTLTQGATSLRSGAMAETPPGSGHFTATLTPLRPAVGDATVTITSTCGDGAQHTVVFTVYIDPSGVVVDTSGAPVEGATVTLMRADTATGPLTPVADGSAVMSPSARTNPETTGPDGVFHWDVIPGFYQVQARKAGCHAADADVPVAASAVYEVPPPAVDLRLVLACAAAPPTGGAPPVVTTVPVTLEGNAAGGFTGPRNGVTVSDPDDPTTALTVTDDAPALLPLGATTVTYTVRDPAGHTATATQVVTVVDTRPPAITCPAAVTGQPPGPPPLGRPTVTDVVDAAPTVGNDAPATYPAGSTTVTWTATDHSGNHASCTQAVSLVGATTLQYTGAVEAAVGATFVPAATLTGSTTACTAGQTVTFALDRNPNTGVAGSFALPSATTSAAGVATVAAVPTRGWQEGVYEVTASYAGVPDRCQTSSDTADLTVTGVASSAVGAGVYPVPGGGVARFGFVVSKRPNGAFAGQLALVSSGRWRLVASVTGYTRVGTAGTLTGQGTLFRWDRTLNRGRGGWAVAGSGVPITARVVDAPGTSGPARNGGDEFGITISFSPAPGQPPLPSAAPVALTNGRIVLR